MAKKVTIEALGGEPMVCDNLNTIQDAFNQLGLEGSYSASVDGEPVADMLHLLQDYNYVSFAPAVKGGN